LLFAEVNALALRTSSRSFSEQNLSLSFGRALFSLLGVFSALLNCKRGFELSASLERPLGAAAAAAQRPLSSFAPVPQNKSETEIGSAARCRVHMQMKARSPPLHQTAAQRKKK